MKFITSILLPLLVFIFDKSCDGHGFDCDNGKIVGGVETTIEEHPYQLSILFNNRHICGASLIRPDTALTAAHCVMNSPDSFKVRAGSTYNNQNGVIRNVIPSIGTRNIEQLEVSNSTQTIELELDGDIPDDTEGVVAGWGFTSEHGDPSVALRNVTVQKINDQKCKHMYQGCQCNKKVTERMVCFASPGKDACQHDAGGPIVVDGKQVGIVSWGRGCARPCFPGVYTRLTNSEISDYITTFFNTSSLITNHRSDTKA